MAYMPDMKTVEAQSPRMHLHALHCIEGDVAPMPASELEAALVVWESDLERQACRWCALAIEGAHLRAYRPHGGKIAKVPLPWAQVRRLDRPANRGTPDLLVVLPPPVSLTCVRVAWLVTVDGGAAAVRHLLAMLSEVGAIRDDLGSDYAIKPCPLSCGRNSIVYSGRSCFLEEQGCFGEIVLKAFRAQDELQSVKALTEMSLLRLSQGHPNVCRMHGIFWSPALSGSPVFGWTLALEHCTGGDIANHVANFGKVTEDMAKEWMTGVLSALVHIHARHIVHRGVKPENIFVAAAGRCVLGDFGSATLLDDALGMQRRSGSPGYAAPELLRLEPYGTNVDCFGAGCVLYFVLSGRGPFWARTMKAVLRRTYHECAKFERLSAAKVSSLCQDVIKALLCKEPAARISATAALRATWFEGLRVGMPPGLEVYCQAAA
mmetsp:Transcript_21992/g.61524  ORF Transcript_21992/g.61524 Transcript_21992/m.61524 type:complete len:434 (+) Transcript_21992:111-1412(+)|eukprot:CAMPEP_0117596382 /NCGR_PEP_ID=MMETSP0784-20121206/74281_1 /TAXON_ID=39447 /ORGANISM="" /LENGTH=433 /DNA_ID=CAMNT_0005398657 /DNA_START=37 /DNA_END=1338 /DNA_ORIENTATION=-